MNGSAAKDELVGSQIEVVESKNKANIGIKGKIIDETRDTILIECADGAKRLIKKNITIIVYQKNQKTRIEGKKLIGRSEERIKR